MKIKNPVLPGFNADPSFIRVGDTYYIANSTFEWFPGVRLHESKDLIHWTLLPSPLSTTKLLNMVGNPSSGGIWAPDLSYADGKFWLIYTDVKVTEGPFKDATNYLTTSTDIHGPWTDPIVVNGVGFDASLFHDDDGRKYLVQQTWDHREYHHEFNGITLTEFDTSDMHLKPETARTIYDGTDVKLVEGPHLYKINGQYYLFTAQGGTVWTHEEVVSRSKSLEAHSFETEPNGPFITNFDTPDFYIQKQGHGALASTPSGEWYYASLMSRPLNHPTESSHDPMGWCTLGRETSIQKVYWDDQGWPRIVGGHGGQIEVEAPKDAIQTTSSLDHSRHDEFDEKSLNIDWNTLRVPFSHKMGSFGDGKLKLIGQRSLASTFDVSMLAQRWQSFNFDAETKVQFNPFNYQQMAGLVNFYNEKHWSWIYITHDENKGKVIEIAQNDNNNYTSYLKDNSIKIPDTVNYIWFRTKIRKLEYSYEYSFDGITWFSTPVILDAAILSDDYVLQTYGGFFTGAFVGVAAVDYSGYKQTATFDSFDYKELK
ncbi:glycoside hydrolase family 43 protein [Ligilactobacillus sp. WILCCON 0076]|uniref:Glycoside hydrolase family 43 protein n=1 Tax=Ligilactobacillus ubinensis TaxID=2876789 RepID=A0A9X2JLW0_9LACO|nr:glycoside hydrolase family 43 protein [Ligilactobacillus ubinensis]MCP0887025.1 glycoside hydrolase family 43 protein [Ligilactobacillus ubinensis]